MPRAKDDINADTLADTQKGFAALEAKVEEAQGSEAGGAEFPLQERAVAPAAAPDEISGAHRGASWLSGAPAALATEVPLAGAAHGVATIPTAAMQAMWGAFEDCAEAGMRFHFETISSFAQVRSPRDLLAVQIAFGQRALGLYTAAITRVADAQAASLRLTGTPEEAPIQA